MSKEPYLVYCQTLTYVQRLLILLGDVLNYAFACQLLPPLESAHHLDTTARGNSKRIVYLG